MPLAQPHVAPQAEAARALCWPRPAERKLKAGAAARGPQRAAQVRLELGPLAGPAGLVVQRGCGRKQGGLALCIAHGAGGGDRRWCLQDQLDVQRTVASAHTNGYLAPKSIRHAGTLRPPSNQRRRRLHRRQAERVGFDRARALNEREARVRAVRHSWICTCTRQRGDGRLIDGHRRRRPRVSPMQTHRGEKAAPRARKSSLEKDSFSRLYSE